MEHYKITLTEQERVELEGIKSKGTHSSKKVINALILLNCDQSQGQKRSLNQDIAEILGVSERKIERVKKRFVLEGLEVALNRQAEPREYVGKIDGRLEAQLIAMSCGAAPAGHARWSLRLLADQAVELKYIESLSHETVRRVLKKTNSSPGKRNAGSSHRRPTPNL